MRLAWFTPWTPQSSGIAGRSRVLVSALADRGHALDVFVDEREVPVTRADDAPPEAGAVRVQSAHDFLWRALQHQYDLIVYQVGNSRQHAFTWPYLFRWPGLVVLHDTHLHHARGQALLSRRHADAYRLEFQACHPEVSAEAAELGVAGFGGAYLYLWPMTRAVAAASRMVAAHTRGGVAALRDMLPTHPVEYLALSSGRNRPSSDAERAAARAALGYVPTDIVFGVFGALTPEKRIGHILRAFRWMHARVPQARLLLAGAPPAIPDFDRELRASAPPDTVAIQPALTDDEFERAIAAADVTVNLRWPTATETSGPWLQALAEARPTIVTALAHQAHVPALDPRTWQPWSPGESDAPVTIAIDLLDEDHSLRLAMTRLATDATLRTDLGRAARAYWEREHAEPRMLADYERVLARAAACPLPPPSPLAGRDPLDTTRALLAPFGDVSCEFC